MSLVDLRFTTVKQQLPDFMYAGLGQFVRDSNSYHRQTDALLVRLAAKHNVPASLISLTAGADQAIFLLSQKYGQRTHVFTPTYVGYSDVRRFGYELHEHYSLNDCSYDIATDHINDASAIFVANPNNPAGITPRGQVLELVENNPGSLVIVDEAYGDFAAESVAHQVNDYSNLVVLRSFSKSYALAGFRIGYLIAQPNITDELFFETTWFNVAYPSIGAAMTALDNEPYFHNLRQQLAKERTMTETVLTERGFTVVSSQINSILIQLDSDLHAKEFVERLADQDILVNQGNGGSNLGMRESLVRISVGTPEQMNLVRSVIPITT